MDNTRNITDYDYFKKAGYFTLNNAPSKTLWKFRLTIKNIKGGLVYIITVNGKIYKIGASSDREGIRSTAGYSCGNDGQPSSRTTGIHYYIAKELFNEKEVEFYVYMCPRISAYVEHLKKETEYSIDPHQLETEIINTFKKETGGNVPPWNKQERGKEGIWEDDIVKIHASLKSKKNIEFNEDHVISRNINYILYYWKRYYDDLMQSFEKNDMMKDPKVKKLCRPTPEPQPNLNDEQIKSMKCTDIKEELKLRNLNVSGNKACMIERLKQHFNQTNI